MDTKPKIKDIFDDVDEQTIEVELPGGIQLGLFNSLPITQDVIGQIKKIVILVLPKINGVNVVQVVKPRIEPYADNPLSYQGHCYFGKVEKVGVKDIWNSRPGYTQMIAVNVGLYSILAELDREMFEKIKEGQFVEICGGMSTLLDIRVA
jgi:hypothetical protein